MRSDRENSPPRSQPSNPDGWVALTRACERLASRSDGLVERVLADCVEALQADRAFLVGVDDRVVARHVAHPALSPEPSRTLTERALRTPVARLWHLPGPSTIDGGSLRRLELRTFLAAPVPGLERATRLLVDSRRAPAVDGERLREGVAAFAALVGTAAMLCDRATDDGSTGRTADQPAFDRILRQVRRAAATRLPVLLQGETGTGKERLARELHRASDRSRGPFVAINCGALPESLLEAELFGNDRGAFTGASRARPGLFRAADGGTLLLDEIGDMPPSMQVKLLRVLQERRVRPLGTERETPVEVRIVGATHRALADEVDEGRFRADLYYRLAVLEIRLPPLRERIDDLPGLIDALTPGLLAETGRSSLHLDREAWACLRRHRWPGNVRELRTVLARALVRCPHGAIGAEHLPELRPLPADPRSDDEGLERAMILEALDRERGIIAGAASRIGWSRQKLYRRMRALGVARPRGRSRGAAQSEPARTWRIASSDSSTFQ